jgi:hypothetical protein
VRATIFAGSQAQTRQQEQKGVVSFANRGFFVTRGQDLLDLFCGKKPWPIGERPCGDGGNARRQVDGHAAAMEQVAQKGPQCRHHHRRAFRGDQGSLSLHERGDVGRNDLLKVQSPLGKTFRQE